MYESIITAELFDVNVVPGAEHVREHGHVLPPLAVLFHDQLLIHGYLLEIILRYVQHAHLLAHCNHISEICIPLKMHIRFGKINLQLL